MSEKKVTIKVSGYITMTEDNLNTILSYDDPHTGLVYCMHMGFVDASGLKFDIDE